VKRNSYTANKNNHASGGIGVLGVLQIIFIVLKCLNLIDWTWVQVFIPTFISLGLFLVVAIAMIIIIWGAANDKL
jgi:hypothetical protein